MCYVLCEVSNSKTKNQHRIARHRRVRAKILGTAERPRVSVFKSNQHVFAQFIDDAKGKTLLSSKVVSFNKSKVRGTKTEKALVIGEMLAEKAKEIGIKSVEVLVNGPGSGRESAVRALQAGGLAVTSIRDITPLPHNGCRPRKKRRV